MSTKKQRLAQKYGWICLRLRGIRANCDAVRDDLSWCERYFNPEHLIPETTLEMRASLLDAQLKAEEAISYLEAWYQEKKEHL